MLFCSRDVSSDVWVGAATILVGAVLGGAVSFLPDLLADAVQVRAQLDQHLGGHAVALAD